MSENPDMYQLVLHTADAALVSMFDTMLQTLHAELTIAPLDADFTPEAVDLLLWHDSEALWCVPTRFARFGVPIFLLAPHGQSNPLGRACPAGYQRADYVLIYPFDTENTVTIFPYWLKQSQKRRQGQ
jgi:hypothetical protein